MRLLRDLWATSPRRTAVVAWLIVLGAAGQTAASALAGPVLLYRSDTLFLVLAVALVVAVVWARMNRIATRWLPPARVMHPFPAARFAART